LFFLPPILLATDRLLVHEATETFATFPTFPALFPLAKSFQRCGDS
jgi:hypothetical protein